MRGPREEAATDGRDSVTHWEREHQMESGTGVTQMWRILSLALDRLILHPVEAFRRRCQRSIILDVRAGFAYFFTCLFVCYRLI